MYGIDENGHCKIPDGVTTICGNDFDECSELTSITIPDSVITIWGHAFYGCDKLTSIQFPKSLTTIGSWAFCRCEQLVSVIIPDSVITIGSYMFSKCFKLRSVIIPNSVATIPINVFYNCFSLEWIVTPSMKYHNMDFSRRWLTFQDCMKHQIKTPYLSSMSLFTLRSKLPQEVVEMILLHMVDKTRHFHTKIQK